MLHAQKDPHFINGLQEIMNQYDDFIVDLWGVIHDGYHLYPHALKTLNLLKKNKKRVIFLSNAPRRASPIMAQLQSLGIDIECYFDLHSSGEDAYESLKKSHRGKVCFPFMAAPHSHLLEDVETKITYTLENADFILNTGPEHLVLTEHTDLLEKAKMLGIPMICVNPDVSVISKGTQILCAGALAQRYEEMGGIVSYHGKPYDRVYTSVWEKLGKPDKSRLCAIGDSLSTDVLGAYRFCIDSILVMTGLEGLSLHVQADCFPAREKLQSICTQKGVVPTYVAPSFCFYS